MPPVAWRSRSRHPLRTPRLAQSWFRAVLKWTLDNGDLSEGGGSAAGHAPSRATCTASGWLRPAHQCLDRRGRVSAPNSDGWREILPRQEMRLAANAEAQKIPAELRDRCFNYLSYSHRCCLRYHGFRHLTRNCKRSKQAVMSPAKGGDQPWNTPPAPQRVPQGGPPSSDGAAHGATGGVGEIQ